MQQMLLGVGGGVNPKYFLLEAQGDANMNDHKFHTLGHVADEDGNIYWLFHVTQRADGTWYNPGTNEPAVVSLHIDQAGDVQERRVIYSGSNHLSIQPSRTIGGPNISYGVGTSTNRFIGGTNSRNAGNGAGILPAKGGTENMKYKADRSTVSARTGNYDGDWICIGNGKVGTYNGYSMSTGQVNSDYGSTDYYTYMTLRLAYGTSGSQTEFMYRGRRPEVADIAQTSDGIYGVYVGGHPLRNGQQNRLIFSTYQRNSTNVTFKHHYKIDNAAGSNFYPALGSGCMTVNSDDKFLMVFGTRGNNQDGRPHVLELDPSQESASANSKSRVMCRGNPSHYSGYGSEAVADDNSYENLRVCVDSDDNIYVMFYHYWSDGNDSWSRQSNANDFVSIIKMNSSMTHQWSRTFLMSWGGSSLEDNCSGGSYGNPLSISADPENDAIVASFSYYTGTVNSNGTWLNFMLRMKTDGSGVGTYTSDDNTYKLHIRNTHPDTSGIHNDHKLWPSSGNGYHGFDHDGDENNYLPVIADHGSNFHMTASWTGWTVNTATGSTYAPSGGAAQTRELS